MTDNLDDLTKEKKDEYESLINPDDQKESKFPFDTDQQRITLSMLMLDKNFLIQSIAILKPNYFLDKSHVLICKILFEFFEKYKALPNKNVFINEIDARTKNAVDQSWYYKAELEAVRQSYLPGVQTREYLLDKITEFAKEQSLKYAISDSLTLLARKDADKWTKIWDLMRNALLTDRNFDLGLDYFTEIESRYERMMQKRTKGQTFTSGFPTIDFWLAGEGLGRGEIGSFCGSSGSGKSNLLIKSSVQNLARGHKVLFLSLEMDQDKLAQRFDVQLSRMSLRRDSENYFLKSENIPNVKAALKDSIESYDSKTRLIIKQYPAGTASVETIRAFLAQLALQNVNIDLLICDYVGELQEVKGLKSWESRERLVRDLRSLAIEENVCVLTAMQLNRGSRQAQEEGFVSEEFLGDSYGQIRSLDALWVIGQSKAELAVSPEPLGRIFVAKHRNGVSRKGIYFQRDPNTLDMTEISEQTYKERLNAHKETKSEEISADMAAKIFRPNGR